MHSYRFEAELWEYSAGQSSWIFLHVPVDVSERIRELPRPPKPGFGSIRVSVTIGSSTWQTSIFPDSKSGRYMLPVKRAIRLAEGIDVGDPCKVELEVLE